MSNTISLNAYSYNNIVSGSSNKLHVPVKPSAVIYAQFDHISGFAAKANQRSVPVSKIQILNTLINQLVAMKGSPKVAQDPSTMSEGQMDSLIKDYQGQIQTSIAVAKNTGYGLAGVAPEAGMLFSIEV